MSSPLRIGTIVGWIAVASAVSAMVVGTSRPLAVALLAIAGLLGATAIALFIAAVRQARAGRAARKAAIDSPLLRLEYLPSVTSRVPLLRWRGSRYWSIGGRAMTGQTSEPAERELIGVRQVPAHDTAGLPTPDRSEGG